MVVARRAHDAHTLAAEPLSGKPGILQCFPCHFHEKPLLGVDVRSFARRNAEERCIKSVDAVDKAAPARVHLPGSSRIVVVELLETPAIRRHFADRVDAACKQSPKCIRAARTRKPAADPRCDRFNGAHVQLRPLLATVCSGVSLARWAASSAMVG
jgi:hypothetical protein